MSEILGNSPVAGQREPIGELSAILKLAAKGAKALKLKAALPKPTGFNAAGTATFELGPVGGPWEIVRVTTAAGEAELEILERAAEESTEKEWPVGTLVWGVPTKGAFARWWEEGTGTLKKIKAIVGEGLVITKISKLIGEKELESTGSQLAAFRLVKAFIIQASGYLKLSAAYAAVTFEGIEYNNFEPEHDATMNVVITTGESQTTTFTGWKPTANFSGSREGLVLTIFNANSVLSKNKVVITNEGAGSEELNRFLMPVASLTLEPHQSAIFIYFGTAWFLVSHT